MLFKQNKVRASDIRSVGRVSSGMVRTLAKRRIWFADDDKDSNDKDGAGRGSSGSSGQGGADNRDGGQNQTDDKAELIEALRKRIAERDNELLELRKFRDKKLEDDGNWQEIAQNRLSELDALKPKSERLDAMLNRISERNKERIAALPEDKRMAAEMLLDRLKPEDMSDWLDTASPLFNQPKAPGTDAGRGSGAAGGTGHTVTLTDAERDMAKRAKMTEEEYLAAKRAVNGNV